MNFRSSSKTPSSRACTAFVSKIQTKISCLNITVGFTPGSDGGLDFGVLKVFDENKQSMSLKNKGRYEISFNFVFDSSKNPSICDLCTVVPQKGVLVPSEKPTQVSVVFRSRSEVTIKDETMLKCQVRGIF